MSLEPQLVPIPFSGGIDTKTDPAQVLAGKLLALENGQFTRGGQITKRFGYDTFSTSVEGGGAVQAAQAIASHENELLLFDGKHAYSHVEATGNWLNRGNAVSIIATDSTIVRITGAQQLNPDVAILKGIEVYAWEDSGGGVRYSVVDATTRAFAVSNALVDVAGVQPKVIAFAGKIVILFSNGTESLYYRTINPLNPTVIGAKTTIFTDGFAAFGYDVAVIGAKLAIGYLSSSTVTGAIQLMTLDQTLAVNPAAPVIVENTVNKAITGGKLSVLSVVGDSVQNIWIGWATGADVRVAVYTYNLVAVLADTVVDASAESLALTMVESPTTALKMQIVYEVKASATYNHLSKLKTTTSGGTVATVGTLRSVGLAAKAFTQDGQSYATFAHESPLQSTYFTAELSSTFPIVAKIGADVGGGLRTNGMLSECSLADTGTWLWANLTKGKIITEANTLFALLGVSSTRFDFAHPNRFLAATSARQLLFVGGILQSYDGSAAVEHGFHLDPEHFTASASGSDGSLSTGSYQYVIVWEWTDNHGQIHRSGTSKPVTVSVTATNHVTLTISTLRLTAKSNVAVAIYRTAVNDVTFHRITSQLGSGSLLNDPTNDTVTFTDKLADADIAADELLYTTGGVLDNAAPPACSLISLYQGRVIVAGLEDPNLLWYSKNRFDNTNFNTIPVEFSASLTLGCDPRGGAITALGLMDDKLIIFKRSAIFVLSGDGPNDTGDGQTFPDPQYVTTDVGCSNPNSVVSTPDGLMFQTDKGIYQLDRSMNATYIGAPVERYNDLEITSSTLDQDANQVIFTTSSGPALVFDYYYDQWSTWTNHDAQDSDSFGARFVFVKASGIVYAQNRAKFTDGGSPVYLSWTTPHLAFNQLNGFQRVYQAWILGAYKSPHSLRVQVAYDYANVYSDEGTIDASQNITTWGSGGGTWGSGGGVWGGSYTPYQFRIDFKRQRCTAISLKVSDTQQAPYGEGYAISALTFRVGALKGAQLPATAITGTQ
jgi:hypothetical protein